MEQERLIKLRMETFRYQLTQVHLKRSLEWTERVYPGAGNRGLSGSLAEMTPMLWTWTGLRPERPPDCDRECWELMESCWNGEPLLRPHVGELEISLRAIYDRFSVSAVAQLPGLAAPRDAAGLRPASSFNEDFTEIDVNELLTTDSDFDFDELTLQ